MRAEAWAVLTAVCWAGGSYFEKRGMKLGAFAPTMGTTVRTATSVVVQALGILQTVTGAALAVYFKP